MNADCIFQIGSDHTVCEDYALSGITNDVIYAIVCDGCSASPHVDFGARVLAFMTKFGIDSDYQWNNGEKVGSFSIFNAFNTYKTFFPYLPLESLDATLLTARVKDKNVTVVVHGDGVIVHKTNGETKLVHIHLTSGAPDYLSYSCDNKRKEAYDNIADNKKVVWTSYDGIHDYKPFVPFIYESPVMEGDTISLISDGINSFRREDNTPIAWEELVDEFTGFKNFEGEFVQRRISAFKRKCIKENWHHSDDISIASIHV